MSRQETHLLFAPISYDYFYITQVPSFAVSEACTVLLSHQGICISGKKQPLNLSHSLLRGLTNLSSLSWGRRRMKASFLILKLFFFSIIKWGGRHVFHLKRCFPQQQAPPLTMKAVKWKWQWISPIHFHDVWDPRHHMSLLLNRESPTTMRASQGLSPVKPAEVSGISIIKVSWVISLIKGCFIFSRKASKMQHEHLHGKGWGKRRYLFPEYSVIFRASFTWVSIFKCHLLIL